MSPITGYVSGCLGSVAPPALDAATVAWIAAVVTNGGSVSSSRQSLVNTLIVGLKNDGLFSKLDRLWLFAGENTASALTDIIADQLATAVNSPSFVADDGYTGNGSTSYVDSNFSPSTAGGNFAQNSGCLFGWSNTSGTTTQPFIGGSGGFSDGLSRIYTRFSDGFARYAVNSISSSGGVSNATDGATGLYVSNRTGATAQEMFKNGSSIGSDSTSSAAILSGTFLLDKEGSSSLGTQQGSMMGCGAGLTSTDQNNLYTRLRTYATAVGLP